MDEGHAVNERHGSRQGAYTDLTPEELRKAGQNLVEQGLKKWELEGRPIYVEKRKIGAPTNVKLFEVNYCFLILNFAFFRNTSNQISLYVFVVIKNALVLVKWFVLVPLVFAGILIKF